MTMPALNTGNVLLDRTQTPAGGYVELYDDGRLRAGYWRETAKPYETADQALLHFRAAHAHNGNPATYRIVATLENYLEQRDDGR